MKRYLFLIVALAWVCSATERAVASPSGPNACVNAKNLGAAKAFDCLVKANNKQVWNRVADFTKCRSKLMTACLKADTHGACPTSCAALDQRVADTADRVLFALVPVAPASDAERSCVASKNKAAARYVRCTAKALTGALAGDDFSESPLADTCGLKLAQAYVRAEAKGGCLTTNDDRNVRALANPAAMNVAGADLTGGRFAFGYLVGADLSDANLRLATLVGGDVTGADLTNVVWDRTICPDATASDTNGSDPESCCAHVSGAVLAACGRAPIFSDPSPNQDQAHAIAVHGSALFIAGVDGTPGEGQWRIEKRSLPDGALAPTFGSGGFVTDNPSTDWDPPRAMATDASYLYVAGYDANAGGTYPYQWRIEKRAQSDGVLVPAFGSGGVVTSNPTSGHDWANGIAIDGTAMYVVGRDDFGWRVEKRSLSDGALSPAFGSGGVITQPGGEAFSSAIDAGAIYVAGTNDFANWRIEKRNASNGALSYALTETFTDVGCGPQAGFGLAVDGSSMYVAGAAAGLWRIERRNLSDGGLVYSQVLPGSPYCDGARTVVLDGGAMYVAGQYGLEGRIEKRNLSDGALVSGFGDAGAISGGFGYFGASAAALDSSFLYVTGTDLINGGDFRWEIDKRLRDTGASYWLP